jgi:urease accessory protein
MSPAFPTGSFAYSHGLEWAIEERIVTTAGELRDWVEDLITRGSGWNDAVLFANCWRHEAAELNELALALAASSERHLETTQLGRAFRIATSAWKLPIALKEGDIAYPIAAATACRAAGIDKTHALLAYLQGFGAALVSVAVRLVPLGQTQGLETLRDLMPAIAATAERAAQAALGDLGAVGIAADIAAMNHETLRSRVFRT